MGSQSKNGGKSHEKCFRIALVLVLVLVLTVQTPLQALAQAATEDGPDYISEVKVFMGGSAEAAAAKLEKLGPNSDLMAIINAILELFRAMNRQSDLAELASNITIADYLESIDYGDDTAPLTPRTSGSATSGGILALTGVDGLALGALVTALSMTARRKKEEPAA